MSIGRKRYIKRKLAQEKPSMFIGKSGITLELLKEIEKQLKDKEMIKAKILKPALANDEAKNIAMQIAKRTEASLIEVRGHTFMLYKHKKSETKQSNK
jgi:RNA-binding protein